MKSKGCISLVLSKCLKRKERKNGKKRRYFKHLHSSAGSGRIHFTADSVCKLVAHVCTQHHGGDSRRLRGCCPKEASLVCLLSAFSSFHEHPLAQLAWCFSVGISAAIAADELLQRLHKTHYTCRRGCCLPPHLPKAIPPHPAPKPTSSLPLPLREDAGRKRADNAH